MAELVICNPIAETVEFSVKPSPRHSDLAGARIGLYWNMKAGAFGYDDPVRAPAACR
jgi:hypothetical protein